MAKEQDSFILNDENKVNSYGFRVPNKEIDLARFTENPVMLDMHQRGLSFVIGRWKNIRVEGSYLLADPEFDVDDPEAKKIAGRVKRGFIKGASLYLYFGDSTRLEKDTNGILCLCNTEAFEASIVDIPSNANSIKLCSAPGEVIKDSEIKLSVEPFLTETTKNSNKSKSKSKMDNFKLSAPALAALAAIGLQSGESPEDVNNSIVKLSADLSAAKTAQQTEKTAREALQGELGGIKDKAATTLVEGAIADGKLTAEVKDSFLTMAKDNYELAAKVIGGMTGKTKLSVIITNGDPSSTEVKSMEDFQKLSTAEQLAFKNEKPEAYKALFA